jgi:hypothetical protein
VTVLFDSNEDGVSDDWERAKLASANGLNHGIAVHDGYLYASSAQIVYRWNYTVGARKDLGNPEIVVKNIPCCHHTSRTIIFDQTGLLYVFCYFAIDYPSKIMSDITSDTFNLVQEAMWIQILLIQESKLSISGRSPQEELIGKMELFLLMGSEMRFLLSKSVHSIQVGLRFDPFGRLWGVENSCDDLYRTDLGGDIHKDNPAEELNFFSQPGRFQFSPR